MGDDHAARHHAAHGVPEQPEVVEAVGVGHRQRVRREPVEAVGGGVIGRIARPVPTVVEHDHAMIDGERLHMVGKVFFGAAEAVHEQEPRRVVGPRGQGRELHAIVDGHRLRHTGHRCGTLVATG